MPKKTGEVIFFTVDFPPMSGGMSRHAYDVARALKSAGEDLSVITPGIMGNEDYKELPGIRVIRLKGVKSDKVFNHYYLNLVIFIIHGFFYCLTHRVKVIFVNTWSLIGPAALILSKIFSISYAVFCHGLDVYSPLKDKKAKWLMGLVLRNSSLVIANSNFTRDLVGKEIKGLRLMVLNPVVDLSRFEPGPGRKDRVLKDKSVILTVGRLVESKNHESVIRAMPIVIKAIPQALYRIIGDGPAEPRLRQLVADLGLNDRVVFEGAVRNEDLPDYFYACEVFVLASREIPERGEVEGFGIVFLEAAACSKASVAGRSGGIADAVVDGETGIIIDPLDIENISSAIIRFLSDEGLRKRLGENARKRVEEDFNMERLRRKIKDIIYAGLDR